MINWIKKLFTKKVKKVRKPRKKKDCSSRVGNKLIPWTKADIEYLSRAVKSDKDPKEVISLLRRTNGAVLGKLYQLGWNFKNLPENWLEYFRQPKSGVNNE